MSQLPIEISPEDVRRLIDESANFGFLDCRSEEENQIATIERATLIPMDQIKARFAEIEPYRDQRFIVHCHHGGRSLMVVEWLRENGFSQAQSMAGGIDKWSEKIDPTISRY